MNIGDQVPANIKLQSTAGEEKSLADFQGQYLVLYFYPKDNTSGCTTQAQELGKSYEDLQNLNAKVVGVSTDSLDSHLEFANKLGLPFELLSDPEHKLQDEFGVWTEKSMFGNKFMGTTRSAFVIDPEGKLIQAWPKISPQDTVPKVKQFLQTLQK